MQVPQQDSQRKLFVPLFIKVSILCFDLNPDLSKDFTFEMKEEICYLNRRKPNIRNSSPIKHPHPLRGF